MGCEPKFASDEREIVIVGANHRHRQFETRGADGALHHGEVGVSPVSLPPRHDGLMGAEPCRQLRLGEARALTRLCNEGSTSHGSTLSGSVDCV